MFGSFKKTVSETNTLFNSWASCRADLGKLWPMGHNWPLVHHCLARVRFIKNWNISCNWNTTVLLIFCKASRLYYFLTDAHACVSREWRWAATSDGSQVCLRMSAHSKKREGKPCLQTRQMLQLQQFSLNDGVPWTLSLSPSQHKRGDH